MTMNFQIYSALPKQHEELCKLAKLSKYTRDFSHMMFSGEAAYDKEWIKVYVTQGKIAGFSCVRHKVREPATSIYFIFVHPDYRGMGIGEKLLNEIIENSPHKTFHLNCEKDNTPALHFYKKHNFVIAGESLKGRGYALEKTITGE